MRGIKLINVAAYLLIGIVAVCITGCSDNPEDAAAKTLQQATTKALSEYSKDKDASKAYQSIQSAISNARAKGASVAAAMFTAAEFQLTQTQKDFNSLRLQIVAINQAIEKLNLTLKHTAEIQNRVERVNQLIVLSDTEIAEMEKGIGSQEDPASLNGKIAAVVAEEKTLLARKSELNKTFINNRDQMLAIESQADDKLRQAEKASGDKRTRLEQDAFDLQLQKKDFTLKAQEAESLLDEVNSQLAIVQPHLKRLQDDLRNSQSQMEALKTAPSRTELQQQHKELTADIEASKTLFSSQLAQLTTLCQERTKTIDTLLAAAAEILDKYQQARSALLEPQLSSSQGQACLLAASILTSRVAGTMDIGKRLEGVAAAYESIIPQGSNWPASSKPDTDSVKKAMDYFDQAVTAYDNLIANAGQLREGSKAAEMAGLKGKMIALYQKMALAEQLGDTGTLDAASAEMDKLKEKGKEYGVQFAQSTTALLVANKGLNFIPSLPVDTAIILESIKKEFASWRQLRGPAMEGEVNKLVTRITEIKAEYPGDEAITAFLDQEQKALDEQKAKGFTEEAAPADANSLAAN